MVASAPGQHPASLRQVPPPPLSRALTGAGKRCPCPAKRAKHSEQWPPQE
eukprot:CAMPEP_0115324596 /NCGR_PEP_ID=MMETSP0270-20121206/82561_1 /TAXON_ID=71861 /ORGANISM="Scrippsiella trochoidea, Strain CCMP3099" /LENGTH=49 /DNA_ID= /DNA_START= /DNA_END= /DNA_ORIENTATION=